MLRFEFKSGTFWCLYYYIFVSCGELCLLVWCCASDRCGMAGNDEDHGRTRKPNAKDQGWSSIGRILSGQMVESSVDAMCSLPCTRRRGA
jgi:hypothetical protein